MVTFMFEIGDRVQLKKDMFIPAIKTTIKKEEIMVVKKISVLIVDTMYELKIENGLSYIAFEDEIENADK